MEKKIFIWNKKITVDTQLVIVKTILQTLYPAKKNEKKMPQILQLIPSHEKLKAF